jgi:hypothetical protein
MRLGKLDYKHDQRTLMLADFLSPTIVVPKKYDFDKGRTAFPLKVWGNDAWGNCVKAGQCNHLLRLERVETRRTLRVSEQDVIDAYKAASGAVSPGDGNDHGLVVLDNLKDWRANGWKLGVRDYKISAFGELHPYDFEQIKAASYLMHGVQFGFSLPRAVAGKTEWTYHSEQDPQWVPGSWGGHLVYGKMYQDNSVEVLTWGEKVMVNAAFVKKYCDEAWAVVDDIDSWRRRPEIDLQGMLKHLRDVGAVIV